jgi:hypothetical protein
LKFRNPCAGSSIHVGVHCVSQIFVEGLALVTFAAAQIGASSSALAYRPFDGTDAAVADVGELEIEWQPAGVERTSAQKTLVAPAYVFNYGYAKNWEAIVEGRVETPLSPSGPTNLSASAVSLKNVFRPGVLQDQSGPSIATEFGMLVPDSRGEERKCGASVAAIVSQRWDWGTIHWNIAGALTRRHNADVFTSAIIEGPYKWVVRPVAEVAYEEEFGQTHTVSGLIGAIWQVRDNLSFDIALRHAVTNHTHVDEIRAGLTFGFPLRIGGMSRK